MAGAWKVDFWKLLIIALLFIVSWHSVSLPQQLLPRRDGTLRSESGGEEQPRADEFKSSLLASSDMFKGQQEELQKMLNDMQQSISRREAVVEKQLEELKELIKSHEGQLSESGRMKAGQQSKAETDMGLESLQHTYAKYEVNHNRKEILRRMRYWLPGNKRFHGRDPFLPALQPNKYMIMQFDCGGFNNIRMSFELIVTFAALTGRTLVFPPAEGVYLLNWGGMTREGLPGDISSMSLFWDVGNATGLNKQVPALTVPEFIKKEIANFPGLERFDNIAPKDFPRAEWFKFWTENFPSVKWRPFQEALYYPSIQAVNENAPAVYVKAITGDRKPVEYTSELKQANVLVFPTDCDKDFRFLGQVASYAVVDDFKLNRAIFRLIRDNVHYREAVFDIASRVVAELGMFGYISMHVRRNDLQYSEEWVDAKDMLPGLLPLLKKHDTKKIYIATDERSPGFFDPFKEAGYQLYFWYDFWNTTKSDALKDVDFPPSIVGLIEQVIAAMGKVFIGTRMSTFTSYIQRLRGYFDAPDQNIYYHRDKYTGDSYEDGVNMRVQIHPQEYIREFSQLWSPELDDVKFP